MKRIAQCVAVLAIALLMVQPVLAGSNCILGAAAACVEGCPMAGMGADCPMQSPMLSSGCPMDCCGHAVMQATEPVAAADRARVAVQVSALTGRPEILAAAADDLRAGMEARDASPPPIYILNRVFRI
jgi:hypothetical protein